MKIFIDAGHGGKDSGATSGGLIEKDMTLMCAKGIQFFLQNAGHETKLSRNDDKYLSLTERANMANAWGANIFVSSHFNAGGGNRGEVIHSVSGDKGRLLAEKIAEQIKNFGQENTRVYSKSATNGSGDYFTVIAKTNMPAVIIEPCFIDNSEDRILADNEDKQWSLGVAIAKGILDYIGDSYPENKVDDMPSNCNELTRVNDIVYELKIRGIITDIDLWLNKLNEDQNSYWLAKKAIDYIRKADV